MLMQPVRRDKACEKTSQALVLGPIQDRAGASRNLDLPRIHEDDLMRDVSRKAHLVRHEDHRASLLGEFENHVEDFADELRDRGRR